MASEDAASKPKGMCIATRCTSIDQFVEMFHRFVDEDSFFVSTNNTRPPGLETSFSVQLTDGTPVLRGLCVVLQAWTNANSPFKTPGVRLGIKRLTATSMPVFERLLVTRSKPPQAALGTSPPPLSRKPDSTPTQVLESRTLVRSKTESTTVNAKPIGDPDRETRTPGSSYVLPANPLMNLTDESLEGYVDCTLYEETANYFPADDDGTFEDALVPPPKAAELIDAGPPPLFSPRPVTRVSAPVEVVADEAASPALPATRTPTIPPLSRRRPSMPNLPIVAVIPPKAETTAVDAEPVDNFQEPSIIIERAPDLRFDDTSSDTVDNAPSVVLEPREVPPPLPRRALASSVTPVVVESPPSAPRESLPAVGFASRESAPAGEIAMKPARRPLPSPPGRKRFALVAGVGALAVATIVSISALGAGDDEPARTTAANVTHDESSAAAASDDTEAKGQVADPTAIAEATKPIPDETNGEAAVVEPEVTEPENTDPDGDGGMLSAGDGPCRIDVASTPAGSMVYLDGTVVAPSPIAIATSCERHKVEIKHPRYKLLSKIVTPTETAPGKVEVTLQRPTHSVSFITQPPGATVFIDGRRAGMTPTTVNMLGFSNLKIEIKKTGYAPISTRHYSKVAQDKFSAKLRKW